MSYPAGGVHRSIIFFPLIYEKIPSEALRWYDLSLANHTERLFEWKWTAEELRLARSVFGEFPDRAISMFKQLIEGEIAQTNKKSYEMAVGHLAELGKLMQNWTNVPSEGDIIRGLITPVAFTDP